MKARTDTLRNRSENWDRFLFAPLRDHADDPAIKRVDEILSLLVAAATHLRERLEYLHRDEKGIAEFLDTTRRMRESQQAYYQTLELLNIKLSRYRWTAFLEGDLDGFRSKIIPAYRKGKWEYSGRDSFDFTELWKYPEYTESFLAQRDQWLTQVEEPQPSEEPHSSWESMESFMVASLLKAVDKGEISRIRRCSDCYQWFYAVRGHQHFCGDVCRRRHEAQNPAFKEKRRIYMRDKYRPLQKELHERGVTQAKGSNQKKKRG